MTRALAAILLVAACAAPRPAPGPSPVPMAQEQTEAPPDASAIQRAEDDPSSGEDLDREPVAALLQPVPPAPSPVPPAKPVPGRTLSGLASWYCSARSACTRGYPASGMFAAAGPALRVGAWRGRTVTVTANGRSVRARLIDFCACPGGRIIDLYSSVVAALGLSLSRGIYTVRVHFSGVHAVEWRLP